eukprot:CAMPEP_0174834318 /NCGR_PEP_ID=MMETSP1114-20130205/4758_1 /TAXON_ID=312471 /ORGANISM="Neobodo designis, Strain CCAP 1951/1" /LENGTH=219 /DNA_ID=CAMNT_0016068225 /DNA_START=305 /DNA_END=964 /DNA_ORIENTATION=-
MRNKRPGCHSPGGNDVVHVEKRPSVRDTMSPGRWCEARRSRWHFDGRRARLSFLLGEGAAATHAAKVKGGCYVAAGNGNVHRPRVLHERTVHQALGADAAAPVGSLGLVPSPLSPPRVVAFAGGLRVVRTTMALSICFFHTSMSLWMRRRADARGLRAGFTTDGDCGWLLGVSSRGAVDDAALTRFEAGVNASAAWRGVAAAVAGKSGEAGVAPSFEPR